MAVVPGVLLDHETCGWSCSGHHVVSEAGRVNPDRLLHGTFGAARPESQSERVLGAGKRLPDAPRFNIRQLTDVLHCKLQQHLRCNEQHVGQLRNPDRRHGID